MSARALLDEAHARRLLAKKSSYQAWKCVSFGCSLLALLLLLAKWQEISSDLQLLANIEQLLWSQQQQQQQSQQVGAEGFNGTGSGEQTWPPASMSTPTISESSGLTSNESASSSNSSSQQQLVVSHMQVSVSRELQAKELLKKELDTFIAEFRSAKSTISLSSLLVGVYLISWILMTLAINDARISNDISVRNILLLSVFGAIDVAASLGFVLIRLIMYSVKNNSFRGEMLASAGLRDTPIRLAPDQLTAFAALRLIGMRSCSAYMDVYVSLIVILLTVLRVYAILQALAYYRHLRRSSAGGPFGAGGGQEMPGRALWSASGRDTPLSEGPKHVWSIVQPSQQQQQQQHWPSYGGANVGRTNSLASSQQAMISGRASPQQPISQHPRYSFQQRQQQHHQLPPKSAGANELDRRTLSARPKAVWQPPRQVQQQRRAPELLLIPSNSRQSQQARKSTASERPIRNESRSPSPVAARRQQQQQQQVASKPRVATNTLRGSDGTTYTLLSANQLERISRKLLETAQDSNNNNNGSGGNNKAGTVARSARPHNQQQLTKRQRRNNFELLLAEADGHSTGCSSLAPNDDDGGGEDDVVVDDDDAENEEDCRSELSNRLVRDEAGYLIEATSQAAAAKTSPTKGAASEQRSNFHELSLSAKNKLLLGEYFYA